MSDRATCCDDLLAPFARPCSSWWSRSRLRPSHRIGQSCWTGAALDEALRIAARPTAGRQDFHARYTFPAAPPIERIEIVTPFRSAVIQARRHAVDSGRLPRVNELRAALRPLRAEVLVIAVVRLDPLHTYIRVPAYSIRILTRATTLHSVSTTRAALGPRRARIPAPAIGGGVSMTAVEVEARFPANLFEDCHCCRVAVIDPEGRTVGIVTIGAALR